MISSGAIIHNKNYQSLLYNNEIDSPVALHLGGSDPEDLAKCIDIVNEYGYDEYVVSNEWNDGYVSNGWNDEDANG